MAEGKKRRRHWKADLARIEPAPAPAAPDWPEGAALLDRLGLAPVARLADLGVSDPALAIAAQDRWDCDLVLIDVDAQGAFSPEPSERARGWIAAVTAAGVDPARIRRVGRAKDLVPCDLVVSTGLFGDSAKIKHVVPFLTACLHADSRLVLDIRKGSGAFPFLRASGEVTALATRDALTRAVYAPAPAPEAPGWGAIARDLMGPDGFFSENGAHSFLFIPRGDTLVVTFDNLDIVLDKRADRRPWGFSFIEKQGWSMLGVMAGGWTWYRDPWVAAEFDRLAAEGFFARFARVVFYGASMGGYAAAAFAAACPGAEVVAISPQSTLDKAVVPWETRYKVAWGRDFSGPYGDAAQASRAARRVTILYDPFEPLDAAHVARFQGAQVMRLRGPLLGHRLGSSLSQMGVLSPIILGALDGTLTEAAFYRLLRARRDSPRYQRELFQRALARGHVGLARKLGRWILARGDNRAVRIALAAI